MIATTVPISSTLIGEKVERNENIAAMHNFYFKKERACFPAISKTPFHRTGATACRVLERKNDKGNCEASVIPGDRCLMECGISNNYRKKTFSNVEPRHAKRPRSLLSSTNQIWCDRCGSEIHDSRSPAENVIRHVSASDCNLHSSITTNQSRKFKRQPNRQCDDSDAENCTLGGRRSGHLIGGCPFAGAESSDRLCVARNSNKISLRTYCNHADSGDNMIQQSCCISELSRPSVTFVEIRRQKKKKCELLNGERLSPSEEVVSHSQNYHHKSTKNSRKELLAKSDLRTGRGSFGDHRITDRYAIALQELILSWIIILVKCFLTWIRITSTSILHRKCNGLTKNCVTFALWALIILPGDSKRVLGNSLLVYPGQFCTRTRFLNTKQQEICQNHSGILKNVEDGILLGSYRCQKEFQYNRWNCSSSTSTYYDRLLKQDVRETAYITAVTSAAVTYAITYACAKGEIPNCGCTERSVVSSYELLKEEARKRNVEVTESQLRHAASTFEWGGCDDVVEFGEEISRIFTDHFGRKQQSRDLRGKIEQHNFEAGRLAVTNHMRRSCRCHGFTGTCTIQTCWEKMPKWQDVGAKLRARFDKAVRVQLNNDGQSLLPTRKQRLVLKEYPYPRRPYPDSTLNRLKRSHPGIYLPRSGGEGAIETDRRRKRNKRLKKSLRKRRVGGRALTLDDEDLVYSQESPNFCKRIRKHGTLGTAGRKCIPNASGAGSCDYLCCGRSYSHHEETITQPCNCRMESCCKVTCDECIVAQAIYTCD